MLAGVDVKGTIDMASAPPLQRPEAAVTYLARREDLELVKEPVQERYGPLGQKLETHEGERVVFKGGVLKVPPYGKVTGKRGEQIKGDQLIKWLDEHRLNGDKEDGFWRHQEPAPEPSGQETGYITDLALDGDVKGLEDLIEKEQSGWNREKLIAQAQHAIERVKAQPKKPEPVLEVEGE